MKNSRVWEATDTSTSALLGRLLSVTARDALTLARSCWPSAGKIRVKLVPQNLRDLQRLSREDGLMVAWSGIRQRHRP